MKALVLKEYNRFVYEDVPVPEIGPDDVLIEVKACGICGSDVHGMDGSTGRRVPPIIMGHEASGIIAEVGKNVKDFSKGDKVTFDSTIYCGNCGFCRHGLINLAVVVGAGIIGLFVIQLLKAAGCGNIFAVDIDKNKLDIACKLGADEGFRPEISSNVPAEILKKTGNMGADVAFEAVGITPTVNIAVESLKKGGSLSLIGNVSPTVELPLQKVVTRQLSVYGSCASCGEYPACLKMIANNKVNVNVLISRVAPLSEGPLWFERLKSKNEKLLKVILVP